MLKEMKGFRKIFAFTFSRHTGTGGYRAAVIAGVLLCLLAPALIMAAAEVFGGGEEGEYAAYANNIDAVFVVDGSATAPADLNGLNSLGKEGFTEITYTDCGGDYDRALSLSEENKNSLILVISENDSGYTLDILRPDDTGLTDDDSRSLESFLSEHFSHVLLEKSGLDADSLAALAAPIDTSIDAGSRDEEVSPLDGLRRALSYVLPYLFIMVIYFLVLFFGNGVANSVIMEKNSKLMDNFLISVRPGAMVVGKTLAIALAGAIAFLSWAAAIALGFALGTFIVKAINPATDMLIIQLFDSLSQFSGLFSIAGAVVALLIVFAGFLLYCSLAAVGGSLAGKPEDLSSTNVLFTLVLIISFFAVLYGGLHEGANPLLSWIPFTSILITPGRVLLGEVSVLTGLGAVAVTVMAALLIMLLAGRLYKLMALYKGDPPKPARIIEMLRESQSKD